MVLIILGGGFEDSLIFTLKSVGEGCTKPPRITNYPIRIVENEFGGLSALWLGLLNGSLKPSSVVKMYP